MWTFASACATINRSCTTTPKSRGMPPNLRFSSISKGTDTWFLCPSARTNLMTWWPSRRLGDYIGFKYGTSVNPLVPFRFRYGDPVRDLAKLWTCLASMSLPVGTANTFTLFLRRISGMCGLPSVFAPFQPSTTKVGEFDEPTSTGMRFT